MLSRKRNRAFSSRSQHREPFHVRVSHICLKAIGTATNRAVRWLRRFARRHPLWFSIMICVVVVAGSLAFRGHQKTRGDLRLLAWHLKELFTVAPPLDQSLDRIHLARDGYFQTVVRYPAKFIKVVNDAHRKDEDILTSFETLDRAWKAGAGDEPLSIRLITPPSVDGYTGGSAAEVIDPASPIQSANFQVLLPFLKDIRTLILEGDGDGRGRLAVSGYQAEPAEMKLQPRSASAGEN